MAFSSVDRRRLTGVGARRLTTPDLFAAVIDQAQCPSRPGGRPAPAVERSVGAPHIMQRNVEKIARRADKTRLGE
jgi:hypothetical protein